MKNLIFKAASMTDFYSESQKPEFYTVLCKEKGTKKGWSYCAKESGEIVKAGSLKEARKISNKMKSDYEAKRKGIK